MADRNQPRKRGSALAERWRQPASSLGVATAGFVAMVLAVVANAYYLRANLQELRDSSTVVARSHAMISALDGVLLTLTDAETSERGYMISGEDSYLEPFTVAAAKWPQKVDALRALTRDDPAQSENAARLEPIIARRMEFIRAGISARRTKGITGAVAFVATGDGKEIMDEIRSHIADMKVTADRLLQEREMTSEATNASVDRSFLLQTLANLVLVSLAFAFVRRNMGRQEGETRAQAGESWLNAGLAELAEAMAGDHSVGELSRRSLALLGRVLDAHRGVIYTYDLGSAALERCGSYAGLDDQLPVRIALGEGLVGEAALQRRVLHLKDLPDNYLTVGSALGTGKPRELVVVPLVFEGRLRGVVEIASLYPVTSLGLRLLEQARSMLAVGLASAEARERQQQLLEETQRQAEELQMQQEELRVTNEELEAQANALSEARDDLQGQQEELRQTNEELEEQAQALAAQSALISARNIDLQAAKLDMERKAQDLERANRYKSEFLANMSHELRTPLNSILILATLLMENVEGNLSAKQIEFAGTMRRAGNDLLDLINDILDLAKVEAGKLDMQADGVSLRLVAEDTERAFRHLADAKGLALVVAVAPDVPQEITSDRQRLEQILRNLLSNALKFTEKGRVELHIERPRPDEELPEGAEAVPRQELVAFRVRDSGIGIPADKLGLIFEAFQQADGSTNRRYGGTGLGLTIARELSRRLGGGIALRSQIGEGSEFTLYLPIASRTLAASVAAARSEVEESGPPPTRRADAAPPAPAPEPRPDVGHLTTQVAEQLRAIAAAEDGRWILVVEDDPDFAGVLAGVAQEFGFATVVVHDGEAALAALEETLPQAVLLDVKLPGISGLRVLERLKAASRTRHVPIHLISGVNYAQNAYKLGAMGYLVKPVSVDKIRAALGRIEAVLSRTVKRVLVVEDDPVQRMAVGRLIAGEDIQIDEADSAAAAMTMLAAQPYDCMILDLRLPDMPGVELLERLGADAAAVRPPVIIYTGQDLSAAEEDRLRRYSESIIIKGARSPERLLEEVSLFMHRVEAELPPDRRDLLRHLRQTDRAFDGRRVLLVDDDMRNVFALTHALEAHGLQIVVARNGREALTALGIGGGDGAQPSVDLVLMDLMMPVMDGFEAIRQIRAQPRFGALPVIALTAKVMKGDQERCFAAGANDYLPKPVDLDALLSLLRVWMPPAHRDDGGGR